MGTLISNKNKIKLWYFIFGFDFSDTDYLPFNVQLSKSKMPTKYVRKKPTKAFDLHRMFSKELQKQVLGEGLSYRKAAENFGVDKMTLAQ